MEARKPRRDRECVCSECTRITEAGDQAAEHLGEASAASIAHDALENLQTAEAIAQEAEHLCGQASEHFKREA